MKTYSAKPGEVERRWWVVDAEGKNLGRLGIRLAVVLRGKNKPQYTPHTDTGDFIVVVNAEKMAVHRQEVDRQELLSALRPPGRAEEPIARPSCSKQPPSEVLRMAVRGMLPKNRLAAHQLTKLKIYAWPKHPHAAQKPEELPWQE